ncbi:hypothetical protein NM688_g1923 [Phlebia brevispora]|uniref:Uncharacterized protein n=1 Tax=Phlebia brevispora TaxID=194682 RepID=A0ACC1T9Y4_9APHY|nr:hypothetical protein NM688_g1923 [Phlebia brevispora]
MGALCFERPSECRSSTPGSHVLARYESHRSLEASHGFNGDITFFISEAPAYMDHQEMSHKIRAVEFYSGIGGLHLALTRSSVQAEVVRAFDWDQSACQVYAANYGPNIVQKVDISTLSAEDLGILDADLWLLSPSCQPYTVLNPLAKGAEDPRARSFIHLTENLLPELTIQQRHPKYMLVENVAGFEFGIPNSRLRYYLLAKVKPLSFRFVSDNKDIVWRHIPGAGQAWQDPRNEEIDSCADTVRELGDYLDEDGLQSNDSGASVVLLYERLASALVRIDLWFNISTGYTRMAERSGSVLQMNEELDASRFSPY